MGQWGFYGRLFPRLPDWAVMGVLLLPGLSVFIITACNQPPFGARPFRRCLLVSMCWYAFIALLAEVLYWFLQPPQRGYFSATLARVLMYLGCISFIPLGRAYFVLRRYEPKTDD